MSNDTWIGVFFLAAAGALLYFLIQGPDSGFDILRFGMQISGQSLVVVFSALIILIALLCSAAFSVLTSSNTEEDE
ncbi:MAG: hypothetical protein WA021_05105 [Minisyncoccia bacterium]